MKKTIISLLTILFVTSGAVAQTNEKIIVHLKNGEQVEYDMNNVDFVEVLADDITGQQAAGISGTVAEAVDLGLSVLWADHNIGATYPTDCGMALQWNAEALTAWGEGWRLPTEKEWDELYNKCKWEWTICDGIGGRTISSSDNKSIFIPAAGVDINDSLLANGSIGIYWTADNDTDETTDNADVKAIGTYFDSANIYRIEYPKTNKFSVRLVKDKQ